MHLLVNEIGYLPLDPLGANLLFQLVSRRYERGSILITSNQSLAGWGHVFGDQVIATAILDRLLHHSTIVTTASPSSKADAAASPPPPPAGPSGSSLLDPTPHS